MNYIVTALTFHVIISMAAYTRQTSHSHLNWFWYRSIFRGEWAWHLPDTSESLIKTVLLVYKFLVNLKFKHSGNPSIPPYFIPLIHRGEAGANSGWLWLRDRVAPRQVVNLLHTCGQFRPPSWSNPHIFGLWAETKAPRGNPRRYRENMQTLHKKDPSRLPNLNQVPSSYEAIVPTPAPPCLHNGHLH